MKKITYEIEKQSIWSTTIRILDKDARMAIMKNTFTGDNIEDVIQKANLKLKIFGYYI